MTNRDEWIGVGGMKIVTEEAFKGVWFLCSPLRTSFAMFMFAANVFDGHLLC